MTSLEDKLARIKASFAEKAPAEARQIMGRSTEDLRASGILDRIPKLGAILPPFELLDTENRICSSDELLAKGPLVLSFYRGLW